MDTNHTMDMTMRTTFYFGRDMTLLFNQWISSSPGQLFGALLVIFVLGILYEGLRFLREHIAGKIKFTTKGYAEQDDSEITPIVSGQDSESRLRYTVHDSRMMPSWSIGLYLLQTILQVVQVGLTYILMLAAMTYNGWIFLGIVFGTGTGYLIFFFWKALNLNN